MSTPLAWMFGATLCFAPILESIASPPEATQMAKVNILANQLHTAVRLSGKLARSVERPSVQQRQAVERLTQLETLAAGFHRKAEENFHHPERTEEPFHELVRAYVEAHEVLLEGDRLGQLFDEARMAMDKLALLYGGYPEEYAGALKQP